MVNPMDGRNAYGKIILDSAEPFAKKILECFTCKDSLDILELTEKPISVNDISARSGHPKATIYRRIPDLMNIGMLIAVGREKNQKNYGRVGSWLYENSFCTVDIRCGLVTDHCPHQCTIIEITSKRKFYGQILRKVRKYQDDKDYSHIEKSTKNTHFEKCVKRLR